jgi:hypothetical protein
MSLDNKLFVYKKHLILWYSVIVDKTLPNRRGVSYMINDNQQNNQLPKELKSVFKELEIFKHLRNAGIKKRFGFTAAYLFQLIFCLIFHHKSWFTLLKSKKGEQYPAKDAVYRFMNHSKFAWRRFLTFFSASTIQKVSDLTDSKRIKALIIDDSMFD